MIMWERRHFMYFRYLKCDWVKSRDNIKGPHLPNCKYFIISVSSIRVLLTYLEKRNIHIRNSHPRKTHPRVVSGNLVVIPCCVIISQTYCPKPSVNNQILLHQKGIPETLKLVWNCLYSLISHSKNQRGKREHRFIKWLTKIIIY